MELERTVPTRGGFFARSLSAQLLLLTVVAVMAAEVVIFVPLLAGFRESYLREKLQSAAVAALATAGPGQPGSSGAGAMPDSQQAALLDALGLRLVAISDGRSNRLIARDTSIAQVDRTISLDDETFIQSASEAFSEFAFGGDRTLRVLGSTGDEGFRTEVVLTDGDLRSALFAYAGRVLFYSSVLAATTALLLWAVINKMMIAPIRRITSAMIAFGDKPSDPNRIIVPEDRADELGIASRELAAMQAKLSETLKEQRRLANLGLAVSKINHDMRNILASSQMISDRLVTLPDPKVQRMAPMLIKSLDRALHYTQSVLAYGRAVERTPEWRQVDLQATVSDIRDLLALGQDESEIEFVNAVPEHFEVTADPEQIHRLLTNLCRNAVQALTSDDMAGIGVVRRLTVGAERLVSGRTLVFVEDSGPGLPQKAKDNLFQAFRGSARSGGTGLGLAIAMEIVEAHNGELRLAQTDTTGTRFEIELPRGAPSDPKGSNGKNDGLGKSALES
ncbi:two component sensor kinase [Fulvimarina pelagi HTCC2506]|uniref:histidine kinase n=1 Tax=Fulvimarina pelagi HTCC2506 TaxID=314231 RepID=Q0G0T4_9HYPH|nr:two component sensor kinase [Fulvimarina pelagi HTCC2506]